MVIEIPKVIENPHDYDARANIMWGGMIAHNNTVGVGRSQDWNSHAIEHELSALYDCAPCRTCCNHAGLDSVCY
jgi:alcohol dehydrogenase YqhD (iron-dependent ADH family)